MNQIVYEFALTEEDCIAVNAYLGELKENRKYRIGLWILKGLVIVMILLKVSVFIENGLVDPGWNFIDVFTLVILIMLLVVLDKNVLAKRRARAIRKAIAEQTDSYIDSRRYTFGVDKVCVTNLKLDTTKEYNYTTINKVVFTPAYCYFISDKGVPITIPLHILGGTSGELLFKEMLLEKNIMIEVA